MSNIRNFCIIAHIDHGKSTLADRFLELTGTVSKREMRDQILDTMDLERERGITIKLQPARMRYTYKISNFTPSHTTGQEFQISKQTQNPNDKNSKNPPVSPFIKGGTIEYELNLIDTPGHVDFAYEVSRSLAAVEGAILLVDASQGVEAQTLANLYLAIDQNLEIIPVINKIDLPNAEVDRVKNEIMNLIGCKEDEIILTSAKTGQNVDKILDAIVERVPPPSGDSEKPLRALIFDSKYDDYKGVVAYVRVVDGEVKKGDKVKMMGTNAESEVLEVGYLTPKMVSVDKLLSGEIGYIVTGLKEVRKCRVGDTVTMDFKNPPVSPFEKGGNIEPLPGYKVLQPMVFASLFCKDGSEFNRLREAMEKLQLNDASLTYEPEKSQALGFGLKCGFLGLLHLDITQTRIQREYGLDLIVTVPSVAYKVYMRNGEEKIISGAYELPDPSQIEHIEEPIMKMDIITHKEYVGGIMQLAQDRRGVYENTEYIDEQRAVLHYTIPLNSILTDFYDKLKSVSSGYASLNYNFLGYEKTEVVRLDILVADEIVEPLSTIIYKDTSYQVARKIVDSLKDILPRQMFEVKIQGAIGAKIIASARISAMRKDVIAKLYGGDVTRKRKLLEKQKKGKKKMKSMGKVDIPKEAFMAILKK